MLDALLITVTLFATPLPYWFDPCTHTRIRPPTHRVYFIVYERANNVRVNE
jgi:hypothetical protein